LRVKNAAEHQGGFLLFMPFKSKAQVRKFAELLKEGKISSATFREWLNATPNIKKLPEKVGKKLQKYGKKKRG
jgi:hypothetical protein